MHFLSSPVLKNTPKILPILTPPSHFVVSFAHFVRSEDSPRIGAPAVYLFNAFLVVARGKTHRENPPKPHPPVFVFFHMGKHACQIYRDFMKISSFENVFLVLFQHVDAI